MYDKWIRGVGANGDKGAYITFKAEEHAETWELAYAMPLDVVFQSVYSLLGEGYHFQFRTNEYHNMVECSAYLRRPRWQDQQYLQCLCDDPAMGLACLLVRLYEDFYGREDWTMVLLEKAVKALGEDTNTLQNNLPPLDEIPF